MLQPDTSVFDAQAVRRLRELDPHGEKQLLERVYKTFDGSLRELLRQLLQAHAQGDAETMRQVAHSLKSSCAGVGALTLAAQAAAVEAAARGGAAAALLGDLGGLRDEADRVLASLETLLGGP
jgi:HPt (histidine-containing phosphotransfer) domain-containing protein